MQVWDTEQVQGQPTQLSMAVSKKKKVMAKSTALGACVACSRAEFPHATKQQTIIKMLTSYCCQWIM